jgi:hypothetical protein
MYVSAPLLYLPDAHGLPSIPRHWHSFYCALPHHGRSPDSRAPDPPSPPRLPPVLTRPAGLSRCTRRRGMSSDFIGPLFAWYGRLGRVRRTETGRRAWMHRYACVPHVPLLISGRRARRLRGQFCSKRSVQVRGAIHYDASPRLIKRSQSTARCRATAHGYADSLRLES